MPFSVNACFEKLRKDVVDLDLEQTKTARANRVFVYTNLESLSQKGVLPRLYSEMNLNSGSFERKTKKCELDDVDMMVCLSGVGGSYSAVKQNELYRITFEKSIPVIKECLEEDGSLYSRKVVNLLIKALGQIQHYKSIEKYRDDEVARLHLMSYPWNFDIVSCFYTAQQFYLIPDGQGNWKNTDPRIDRMRVTSVNQSHYQIALPLIRLMKYWKELKWGKVVSSYMSEPIPLGMSWQVRVTGSSLYYRCRKSSGIGPEGDSREFE